MDKDLKGKAVAVLGALVAVLGLYNLVTVPDFPDDEGLVARLVRAVSDDFTEILEWIATTAVVNSVALVVVGVALVLVGLELTAE